MLKPIRTMGRSWIVIAVALGLLASTGAAHAQGVDTQTGEFSLTGTAPYFFYRNTWPGGAETVMVTICASAPVLVGTGHIVPPISSFSPLTPGKPVSSQVRETACKTFSIVQVPVEFGVGIKRLSLGSAPPTKISYTVSKALPPSQLLLLSGPSLPQ